MSRMEPIKGFILDSVLFYRIAKAHYIEARKGFEIHRQNDALVSIIFCALSLEAFINEVMSFVKDAKQAGETEAFFDKLINAIEESSSNKKNTQHKFMAASLALNNGFNKGKKPYQDFADLFRLRDCLVHLKPEDVIEEGENGEIRYVGRKLIESLSNKGILLENTTVESITLKVSTAKAALWACNTASEMVQAILDKLPKSFSDNNEVISWYRSEFQPPNS